MPSLTTGRLLRYGGIVILAAVAFVTLWPSLFSLQSNRAIINARVTTLSAPIDGHVQLNSNVSVGTRLSAGDVIGNVVNRNFTSELPAIRAETKAWQDRLEALGRKQEQLQASKSRLAESAEQFQTAYISRLESRIAQARHELNALKSRRTQLQAQEARIQKLLERGSATQARYDEIEADLAEISANVLAKADEITRLEKEHDAAGNGIYLGDGYNNTPYSTQRVDEIALRLTDLQAEIADARAHRRTLQGREEVALQRQDVEGIDALQAPTDGYVWEILSSSGEQVSQAAPVLQLVNCTTEFVDVTLPQSRLEDVNFGQRVDVRILNTDRRFQGRVAAVRGASTVPDNLALQNVDLGRNLDEIQVLVQLENTQTVGTDHRFCNVGQRVTIDFKGGGLLREWIQSVQRIVQPTDES